MRKSAPVGRPREFDEDVVMEKIMNLFWEHGYEGTGLSDIMRATGLQKGSLYKAWGSKHEMYIRALTHYDKTVVKGGVKMLTATEPARTRILNFMSSPIDSAWKGQDWRGCFLCNASADFAANDEETRTIVQQGYGKLVKAMSRPVAELHPDWNNDDITRSSRHLVVVYSGLRVMARSAMPREFLENARDVALAMI